MPTTPTLTSFTPTAGAVGTVVTITGTDFTSATAVTIDGVAAVFTADSDTSITATVGSTTVGSGVVVVTTPDGVVSSTGTFRVIPVPTLTSFTPATAATAAVVTVLGTGFTDATAVKVGGVAATSFAVVNDTTLTVVLAATTVTGTIAVTTPGGVATSANTFTFISAPTITSFTPTAGAAGTVITITGTHLAGTSAVTVNAIAATAVTVVNATTVTATVAGTITTPGTVTITTPGGSATSSATFTLWTPPTITKLDTVAQSLFVVGTNGIWPATSSGNPAVQYLTAPSTPNSDNFPVPLDPTIAGTVGFGDAKLTFITGTKFLGAVLPAVTVLAGTSAGSATAVFAGNLLTITLSTTASNNTATALAAVINAAASCTDIITATAGGDGTGVVVPVISKNYVTIPQPTVIPGETQGVLHVQGSYTMPGTSHDTDVFPFTVAPGSGSNTLPGSLTVQATVADGGISVVSTQGPDVNGLCSIAVCALSASYAQYKGPTTITVTVTDPLHGLTAATSFLHVVNWR